MAGTGLSRLLLTTTLLLMGAGVVGYAQSAGGQPGTGTLNGQLTDLHSTPLSGVEVVVRNEATGAELRTTTTRKGEYRFAGLTAGTYLLTATSERLGRGQVELEIDPEQDERVQTAMEFMPDAPDAPAHAPEIAVAAPTVTASVATEPAQEMALTGHAAEIPATAKAPAGAESSAVPPARAKSAIPVPAKPPEPALPSLLPATSEATKTADASLTARAVETNPALAAGILPAAASLVVGESAAAKGAGRESAAGAAANAAALRVAQGAVALSPARAVATPPTVAQQGDAASQAATEKMSGEEMRALPSSGRRWQDLLLDTPTAAALQGGLGVIALRGAGQVDADTAVDGASTRLAFGTAGSRERESGAGDTSGRSGLRQTGGSGRGLAVAQAAIRVIESEAGNVEAEGSAAAGGRLSVETESGGRTLHGQGFLFERQNLWGAQNPFTQWMQQTAAGTGTTAPVFTGVPYTPQDREVSWGLGAGGPIRRDKLFWFAAVDSSLRSDPGVAMVKHPYLCQNPPRCTDEAGFFAQPTNDQMQVLSARLGLSAASPVSEGLAAYSSMLGTLDGLLGPASRTAAEWVGFGRVDWQAAERHRLVVEASGADWNSPGGGMSSLSETYGNHSFGNGRADQVWLTGRWEMVLRPNLVAVTQATAGRAVASTRAGTPSAFEQTLNPNGLAQLPQMVVDSRYGFTIGAPARFGNGNEPDERVYHAAETLIWTRGAMLVKAGFEASHNADVTGVVRNEAGTFSYSNVENFVSDALTLGSFGLSGILNPTEPHGCDQTGKVWRDSGGNLRGLGYLPCYSYYSQTLGPRDWHLSTNDWAGFASAQWRAGANAVFSAGLRWDREQLPPPIAALSNPELPQTQALPSLGNNWGPRFSVALGKSNERSKWPVVRLGYGLYYGRTENAMIETVLTQTGSANGDRSYFIRPTDGLNTLTGTSDAPLFPYVLHGTPTSEIKPGAAEFAPNFRNPEVHQAVVSVEEELPGRIAVTASGMASLGRRLPVTIDTNIDPAVNPQTITYAVVDGTGGGPIKTAEVTVPFYASWPSSSGTVGRLNANYQQIAEIMSKANSTYEAATVRVSRSSRRGLDLVVHYTYAHAMDWNPNESPTMANSDVLDPANFKLEYGTSDVDVRHSVSAFVIYEAPWKLRETAGRLVNGWMLSAIGRFHTGYPYTMRTTGSLAEEFDTATGAAIVGLGAGMNGSGGDDRVYGVGRNTFRYPSAWKADMRLGRRFDLGRTRELELLAESYNLFNHSNVTAIETTGYYLEPGSTDSLPTLNFLTGLKANTTAFGQPLASNATSVYHPRQFEFGMQFRF